MFVFFERKEKKWGDKMIEIGCIPKGSQFYSDNGKYKLIDDGFSMTINFIVEIIKKYDYWKYHPVIETILQPKFSFSSYFK